MRIGFDLQAPINKATAAIEAAKMSGKNSGRFLAQKSKHANFSFLYICFEIGCKLTEI